MATVAARFVIEGSLNEKGELIGRRVSMLVMNKDEGETAVLAISSGVKPMLLVALTDAPHSSKTAMTLGTASARLTNAATSDLRWCDWVAFSLSQAKRTPFFDPFATVAERDATIDDVKKLLAK
jgi:hypothetical protein